jgi:hypothetical protein
VSYGPAQVIPFEIDLSSIARRSVASLYSHLITRPTGRALRLGIESQLCELNASCLSVLDFTQVVVLDYSCADEAVAKLVQRYVNDDRPADVYFVARGLGEQHREPIETVLARHGLALAAEVEDVGYLLLGLATQEEQTIWVALERARSAAPSQIARALGATAAEVKLHLDGLTQRRVVLRQSHQQYFALSALLDRGRTD